MKIDALKRPSAVMTTVLFLIAGLLMASLLSGCASYGQAGAFTGALAGAAVGGLFGPDPTTRTANAIIGAGIGMFTGAAVGEQMDRDAYYRGEYYRQYGYKYDPQYGWYRDPYWQGPTAPSTDRIVVTYD